MDFEAALIFGMWQIKYMWHDFTSARFTCSILALFVRVKVNKQVKFYHWSFCTIGVVIGSLCGSMNVITLGPGCIEVNSYLPKET